MATAIYLFQPYWIITRKKPVRRQAIYIAFKRNENYSVGGGGGGTGFSTLAPIASNCVIRAA